jgi:heme-degrading monooxygenase HmoA
MQRHKPTKEDYRETAKACHNSEGYCEVDDNAEVSESDDGAYVQAWVWIPKEDTQNWKLNPLVKRPMETL